MKREEKGEGEGEEEGEREGKLVYIYPIIFFVLFCLV